MDDWALHANLDERECELLAAQLDRIAIDLRNVAAWQHMAGDAPMLIDVCGVLGLVVESILCGGRGNPGDRIGNTRFIVPSLRNVVAVRVGR